MPDCNMALSNQGETSRYTREDVLDLMKDKDNLEEQIGECLEILKSENVTIDEPLVDSEGYPRDDVDVYQIRHARHRIICLRNDLKSVMAKIEEGLASVHEQMREAGAMGPDPSRRPLEDPVARVGSVMPGSPAALAGLEAGDVITTFGSVNARNFTSVANIADVVRHSIGRPVRVGVRRESRTLALSLTPKQWSGKGVLGCTIQSLEDVER